MHLQTHLLAGWCLANVFPMSPRQRCLAMVAAASADLDGIGIIFGQESYWDYHHKLGHNAAFGLLVCVLLTKVARGRTLVFSVYLALFHLHLLMDFFGSGPGWPIAYLW